MVAIAEREKTYLIPVHTESTPLDLKWVQIKEIPVFMERREIPASKTATIYMRFPAEKSPLSITAGGWDSEGIATVQERIRAQMLSRLEHALSVLNTSNAHKTARLEVREIGQYFSPAK